MHAKVKVLVTGAAGHLGSHCVPALLSAGFDVRGTDLIQTSLPGITEFVQADLRDRASLRPALSGVDLIVHCASIHPWREYTDAQYLDTNIKGTWNLYSEASELGITRVVLTSSISAIGYPTHPAKACPITEDMTFPLKDIYALTKNVQENIARVYAERREVRTVALRPPPFMPRPTLETGFLLTGVFSLVDDIASAHVAAARMIAADMQMPDQPFDAVFVVNQLPYTTEDIESLGEEANVLPLVQKHWPEEYLWLRAQGYRGARLVGLYDLGRASRLLGWSPRYNFEDWHARNATATGGTPSPDPSV